VILNYFVKTSAICSLILTNDIHIMPSSSLSLMKCRSISTCLVLSCCIGLFAMFITALLSQYSIMGLSSNNPNSSSNLRSHNPSLTPWAGSILNLSHRSCHYILFFASPRNQITPHKCTIARSRLSIIETPSPISIGTDFDPHMSFFYRRTPFFQDNP
jgi:hypothetical protein